MTPIDTAFAAMEDAPEDEAKRLAFFGQLAGTELFFLLGEEPQGEDISPELFDVEGQTFALIFDREERLAEFVGREAPYLSLSGKVLAEMLAGKGIGLALNPEVAPSEMLLPPEAVDWLADILGVGPQETSAQIEELTAPDVVPDALLEALDMRLAAAEGRARFVWLCGARYQGGTKGHLLAFVDPAPGAEGALAGLVNEALTFSGIPAGVIDVVFFKSTDEIAARLAKVGLRIDLPQAEVGAAPKPPGSDGPPRLR